VERVAEEDLRLGQHGVQGWAVKATNLTEKNTGTVARIILAESWKWPAR
jgi:hypothetical protein